MPSPESILSELDTARRLFIGRFCYLDHTQQFTGQYRFPSIDRKIDLNQKVYYTNRYTSHSKSLLSTPATPTIAVWADIQPNELYLVIDVYHDLLNALKFAVLGNGSLFELTPRCFYEDDPIFCFHESSDEQTKFIREHQIKIEGMEYAEYLNS